MECLCGLGAVVAAVFLGVLGAEVTEVFWDRFWDRWKLGSMSPSVRYRGGVGGGLGRTVFVNPSQY